VESWRTPATYKKNGPLPVDPQYSPRVDSKFYLPSLLFKRKIRDLQAVISAMFRLLFIIMLFASAYFLANIAWSQKPYFYEDSSPVKIVGNDISIESYAHEKWLSERIAEANTILHKKAFGQVVSKSDLLKLFHEDKSGPIPPLPWVKFCLNSCPLIKITVKFDQHPCSSTNELKVESVEGDPCLESPGQEGSVQLSGAHEKWLLARAIQAQSVKLGMSRAQLLERFEKWDGGITFPGPDGLYCLKNCSSIGTYVCFAQPIPFISTECFRYPDNLLRISKLSPLTVQFPPTN